MTAAAINDGLCLLEFSDRPGLKQELDKLAARLGAEIQQGTNAHLKLTEKELLQYFQDASSAFTVPLVLAGSDFEQAVWKAVCEVRSGETRTYAQIAAAIGRPKAFRAVGRANGSNPVCIIIPCHRLIGSDGGLHSYGGGLWRKQWLLDHEKKELVNRD